MKLSRLSQFHENPVVIAWWCARLARLLEWLTPTRRRLILAALAVWVGFKRPLKELAQVTELPVPADGLGSALVILVLFAFLWLCYKAAASFSALPAAVRRHPILTLHLLYWGGLAILWNSSPAAGLWRSVLLGVGIIFPFLIWRCGYVLLAGQHGRIQGTTFLDHLLTLWPVYGGSNTPYGKGLAYLSRCEAKTPEELARSQLAGLKLLFLCLLWRLLQDLMEALLYGPGDWLTARLGGRTVGVPRLRELVYEGGQAPLLMAWASIYCELVWQVLEHAIAGHRIIGILRLFGFNVFRNTYKPLLAESIVEFWNRYYYYFKELLVNFFFMPTFTQLGGALRKRPQLRLFLAVFAAAFVGNVYYHLLQYETRLVLGDVFGALYQLRCRMFYCLLLVLGIYLSMARAQRRGGQAAAGGPARRLLRIAGVWTFFSLIFIWNVRSGASFLARVDFFLGLFGLS